MFNAMNMLGFKSYHFSECVLNNGLPHLRFFNEALTAQFNRLSGIRRYNKADFDKWMAEYDVSRYLLTPTFIQLEPKWSCN